MLILIDSRQQAGKHDIKERWFAEHGIETRRTKLYVGDYSLPANQSVCIDTKKDIQELVSDICGKQHERFRNECMRAQEAGIRLVVLVENKAGYIRGTSVYNNTIRSVNELHKWKNPRAFIYKNGKQLYPTATRGITIQKACMTMTKKYSVDFQFCSPEESAQRIVELLGGDANG